MSVFDICERTLGLVKGRTLEDLTAAQRSMLEALNYEGLQGSNAQEEAVTCVRHFAVVRDRLLSAWPWTFTRARVSNMVTSTAVIGGWRYNYSIPDDCLRVLACTRQGNIMPVIADKWEILNNRLVSHYPITEMFYTARPTSDRAWVPIFTDAFCYALAAQIAGAVTGSFDAAEMFEQGCRLRVEEAYRQGHIRLPLVVPPEAYNDIVSRTVSLVRGKRQSLMEQAATSQQGVGNAMDLDGVLNAASMHDETVECDRHLPRIRDGLLQQYPWVFARKSVALPLTGERLPGWRYTYQVPSDCLRPLQVVCNNIELTKSKYEIIGNRLGVNEHYAVLRYTSKQDDPNKWDATFTNCVIFALAGDVAIAVTGAGGAAEEFAQSLKSSIAEAYRVGTIDEVPGMNLDCEWGWRTYTYNKFFPNYIDGGIWL